jgi:hypothetical protein
MTSNFRTLWGHPKQDLRLLAAKERSVNAFFYVGDGSDGPDSAVAAYITFATQIALPSSAVSLRAIQLGIPIQTVDPPAPPASSSNSNAIIIGAILAGLTAITFIVAVVILIRNRCRDHGHVHSSGPSSTKFNTLRGDNEDMLAERHDNDDLF